MMKQSELAIEKWTRIRERFHRLSLDESEVDVLVVNYDHKHSAVSDNEVNNRIRHVHQWADTHGLRYSAYFFESAIDGRPCHRECYVDRDRDLRKFLQCADAAARQVFQLPQRVAETLWHGYFVPKRVPQSSLVLWADAVLQLAIRNIDGSALSQSAECWYWDMNLLCPEGKPCASNVPNAYLSGEMDSTTLKFAELWLPQPFWHWFADLGSFISKSCDTIDWIIAQLGDGSLQDETEPTTVVILDPPQITIDERAFALTTEQALYLQQLLNAKDWMSDPQFKRRCPQVGAEARPDRWRKDLPNDVKAHLQTEKGKGTRWLA